MPGDNPCYMFGEDIDLGDALLPASPEPSPLVTDPTQVVRGEAFSSVPSTPDVSVIVDTPPAGWKSYGRGTYLQTLLQLTLWTDDQLVSAVHAYYPNSRTGPADVKFNASLIARRVGVKPRTLRIQAEKMELLPPPPWDPRLAKFTGEVISPAELASLHGDLMVSEMSARSPGSVSHSHVAAPAAVPQAVNEIRREVESPPFQSATVLSSEKQPSRFRKSVDPNREFDKTSLRERGHLQWCHRDSLAHLTRWAFAGRFIDGTKEVLDVGCGPDVQLVNILTMPRNNVPKRYVGVDLNNQPQRHPTRQWATIHWQFNFIERFSELGRFDVVTNLEVLEHMERANGLKFLAGLKGCLKPDGTLLLSTPVFDGHAASVHLHEWKIDELAEAIKEVGLRVENRFGTFASAPAIRRVASEEDLRLIERLKPYYGGEYLSIVLAPLYPDASRNNLWVLKLA